MRSKSIMLLLAVVLLAVAGGIFVYPKADFGKNVMPWKLGLDLIGGTQLIYEIDMSAVAYADRDSVVAGLRDVIEKRVNLFGVSEPNVVSLKSGDSQRLLVELAGVRDVRQAIQLIGETPFLVFSEVDESAVPVSTTSESVAFKPT